MTKLAYAKGESAPLLETTIGARFDAVVANNPDSLALVMPHQDIRWTYAQLQDRVDALATGFIALGVRPQDRVGIWSPNRYEWVLTQLACAKMGAILVCINPAYRLYELEYALNKVECKVIVTAERFKKSDYLGMLKELAPELEQCVPGQLAAKKLPVLKSIIRVGEEKTPGMFNFREVTSMGGAKERELFKTFAKRLKPEDVINIQFTSGTTGSPKGAALRHIGILNNGYFLTKSMRLDASDKLCIPVPLYHCFGMVMGVLACISIGATMVLPAEVFNAEATLKAVSEEKCTALHGVPTMFFAELDLPNFSSFDLSSLRTGTIAGASCPVALMKRLIAEMDLKEIVIAYGQTECSPVDTATAIDDTFEQRTTTIGRPHYNWECKIVDTNTGDTCQIGETGEICARGYGVMAGYWGDEALSKETIDTDGYLHSGDLGEMDADGFIKVTGRIKDMIIRGGENIYPREVEEFLYTHPAIAEAQIFGLPDEKYGEQVAAWIQLRPGKTLAPDQIRDFCEGKITHFKIPKFIKIVDSFPMTVTGKMKKFIMRDLYAKELGITVG